MSFLLICIYFIVCFFKKILCRMIYIQHRICRFTLCLKIVSELLILLHSILSYTFNFLLSILHHNARCYCNYCYYDNFSHVLNLLSTSLSAYYFIFVYILIKQYLSNISFLLLKLFFIHIFNTINQ